MVEGTDRPGGVVRLDGFELEADLPRLAAWLRQPHVAPFWPDPDDQLADARQRRREGQMIIMLDDVPVGYMRWQRADPVALEALGLHGIPAGSVDMDILIGEPGALGRGVGRRAVRLLRDRLLGDPTIPLVGIVSSVKNVIALRSFRAAGFSAFGSYDDPRYGRCEVLVARAALRSPM